jgi:hypothetical protein
MAVPCDETVEAGWLGSMRVDLLVPQLPLVFERRSCGHGAKGEYYDWAVAEVSWPSPAGRPAKGWTHLLLVRRSISDPGKVAYFAVHAPIGTTITTLVQVAGLCWSVEDCFETAKSDCGLDQYEVRMGTVAPSHHAVHGRVGLLVGHRRPNRTPARTTRGRGGPRRAALCHSAAPSRMSDGVIAYTCEEIRRLLHQTL